MATTIQMDSLFDARTSVVCVREAFHDMTGEWCTEAQALAACYSVPDGAPIEFAALNVGCALTESAARHFEAMRSGVRGFCRVAPR